MVVVVNSGLDAVAVVDSQGVQYLLPDADPAGRPRAVLEPFDPGQTEHLERCLLDREVPSVPDRFAESRVQRLDGVGPTHELSKLAGTAQERHEIVPRRLPGRDHRRIPFPPRVRELAEPDLGASRLRAV